MNWEKNDPEKSYSRINGMDPFADWLLGSGFADFARNTDESLLPFTIGPLDESMIEFLGQFENPDAAAERGMFIPWLYRDLTPGQHVVALATRSVFDDIANLIEPWERLAKTAKQIDLGLPLNWKSLPDDWISGGPAVPPVPPPVLEPGGWPDGTVVVGIIDDGIAFAHERFRLGDGTTRVQYFWHQDGKYRSLDSTVGYGNEICKLTQRTRKGIDQLLLDHIQAGLVDEDGLYREAGLADFRDVDHKAVAWRRAHGTHILDHAAGYAPRHERVDRPIIAVQLPVSVTADTSGSNLKPYTLDAINYILDRADRLAGKGVLNEGSWRPLPVVINFSYGMIAGPHDGTLDIEQTIDLLSASRSAPLRVVLPAGNANLSRCHAKLMFKNIGDQQRLDWRVQPDDLTPTFMEIWLPHDPKGLPGNTRVTVRISTPSGETSADLTEGVGNGVELISNGLVIASGVYNYRPFPTERGVFAISLAPSARLGGEPGSQMLTAPSGLWTITVTNTGLDQHQELNAWIQWDDVIYGYRRGGRQSYFEAECYTRFDAVSGDILDTDQSGTTCQIRRAGTINAIATGREAIVIGGVQQKDLWPPKYTASGPTIPTRANPPHRDGPDAACVSDDSRIHTGILGAGSRSGTAVLMNGTSVSVPQIVRLVAKMLGKGGLADRDAIKRFAQAEELSHQLAAAGGGVIPPPLDKERSGWGRVVQPRPSWPRGVA